MEDEKIKLGAKTNGQETFVNMGDLDRILLLDLTSTEKESSAYEYILNLRERLNNFRDSIENNY